MSFKIPNFTKIFKKYVPPITPSSPKLPETKNAILKELLKQDSLLAQIHAEMNAGFVSKKREEQLWEVQRIITQLKRKFRILEKKQETTLKSIEDNVDGEGLAPESNLIHPKAKSSCSDDESLKTITGLLTNESADLKKTPQETFDIPSIIPEEKFKEHIKDISPYDGGRYSDKIYLHESGLLMLPEYHPEYLNLIKLQLENQELLRWKSQLQTRINVERAEIVKLKKLLTLAEGQQQQQQGSSKGTKPTILNLENNDFERIIEHYLKENTLLEHKRKMLAKEIFEENKELIQFQVELSMQGFRT